MHEDTSKCQSRKNLLKSSAGRELNGEISHEYILVEYFRKELYSLARKELTFWEKGEFLSQFLTASDNYDCLAARSWIQWPMNSQVYFCCQFFSLPPTPDISICRIFSSVFACLYTFLREKIFFRFFPFSQWVLPRRTTKDEKHE